jgi:hypothetical protein
LTDNYESAIIAGGGESLYRFSTKRRHEKTIGSIERALQESRNSPTAIKFNGSLEPGDGILTEIGKERFLLRLERRVIEHGQQSFYNVKDLDGKVVNLSEHSHCVKVKTMIEEHICRCNDTNKNFEQCDRYEHDKIELAYGCQLNRP